VARFDQALIGILQRPLAQIAEDAARQPRLIGKVQTACPQEFGRLTVVEHKLVIPRADDHPDRHIREEPFQTRLFLREPGGFATDGLGQGAARFGEPCPMRRPRPGQGRPDSCATSVSSGRLTSECARARRAPARRSMGRATFLSKSNQTQAIRPSAEEARDRGNLHQPLMSPPRAGTASEPSHTPSPIARPIPPPARRRTAGCAGAGSSRVITSRPHGDMMRRISPRNVPRSNGLVTKPSAPSAIALRFSNADPRAVIISTFTSVSEGSSRIS
jgi:hypothetical protein